MSASREKRLRRELREAEANSDIVKKDKPKKQKAYMAAARKKKIYGAIKSAIGILIVLVLALLIFFNCGYLQKHTTALKVGDHKITPVEFNYFYQDAYYSVYNTYSSYGMWNYMVDTSKPIEDQECTMDENGGTWTDYLTSTASDSALQTYALYDAAMADGYTLSEDAQASIDSTRENLDLYATSNGFKNADDYLEDFYGKGASVDSYISYLTLQQTASGYATSKTEGFTYSEDELKTYYDENRNDFDSVTYRVFSVSTENDDTDAAKATADAMKAELDGSEQSFIDAARKYAPEDMQESYEDDTYTLRKNSSYATVSSNAYGDWLFSGTRLAGETEVFATDTGYSVIMFVSRDDNQYQTVNVRHILAKVATSGEDSTSTDQDWDDCLAAITEVENAWNESDKSEEAFADLAMEYSDDSSSTGGGLIEDVRKGQMVQEFEDWCFDDARQIGDSEVVKTQYGYHLMYFSGVGDYYWKTIADSSKRNADYTAWYEEFSSSYSADTKAIGQWFTEKALPSA